MSQLHVLLSSAVLAGLLVPASASAQVQAGDILASVESVGTGGPGRVYRINDGGDLTGAVPFIEMDGNTPVIDICSTPDGRVLASTSTKQTIYDITTGTAVAWGTVPGDASGLYCGPDIVIGTSLLMGSSAYDVTVDPPTEFAAGINRSVAMGPDGLLWGSRISLDFSDTGGVFRDIQLGDDLTNVPRHFARSDVFQLAAHKGRMMASAFDGGGIVDITAPNTSPTQGYAIVPGVRGIASDGDSLWATTVGGHIFEIPGPGDYSNASPHATLPGPSLSVTVVQICGDGQVHGQESCDDGNVEAGDGCSPVCRLEGGTGGGGSGAGGAGGGGVTSSSVASTSSAGGASTTSASSAGGGSSADEPTSGCQISGASSPPAWWLLVAAMLGLRRPLRRRRAS